jgi:hypothetical protein
VAAGEEVRRAERGGEAREEVAHEAALAAGHEGEALRRPGVAQRLQARGELIERRIPAHRLERPAAARAAPAQRLSDAIGIVEDLQAREPARPDAAAIHRRARVALDLDGASLDDAHLDAAAGRTLRAGGRDPLLLAALPVLGAGHRRLREREGILLLLAAARDRQPPGRGAEHAEEVPARKLAIAHGDLTCGRRSSRPARRAIDGTRRSAPS